MSSLSQTSPGSASGPSPRIEFSRLVVGLEDASDTVAILTANAVAERFDGEVHGVHGLPSPPGFPTMPPIYYEEALAAAEQRMIDLVVSTVGQSSTHWHVSAEIGSATTCVLDAARLHHAQLIVLGSHGRSGMKHAFLGSVSETILAHAACPVLVLGPNVLAGSAFWRTVLFATDLERTGLAPAHYATMLAAQSGGSLHMLHVLPKKESGGDRRREWIEDDIRRQLERLVSPGTLAGCGHCSLVAYGTPAEEILATAESIHADLVVVGTGVHGFAANHAPSRVITQILHSVRCPVSSVGSEVEIQ